MIVTQSRTADERGEASHQPASTNQITLPMHALVPVDGCGTSARPNGHSANPASLNAWTRTGCR